MDSLRPESSVELESIIEDLLSTIGQASSLYYRLVLVVGPARSGKSAVLRELSRRVAARVINLSSELSQRLLDLTPRERALEAGNLVREIVNEATSETGAQPASQGRNALSAPQGDVVLLDNIELLFDPALKLDPLRLLQLVSRNVTVIATWPGSVGDRGLTYAVPGHPEYRRYEVKDFLVFCPPGVILRKETT